MTMPTLLLVDTDEGFEKQLRMKLMEECIDDQYEVNRVVPDTTLERADLVRSCVNEIALLAKSTEIAACFVDIVVLEKGVPDALGIDIAREIRTQLPNVPLFNMTSKYMHEEESDILSEATLEDIDGVLVKSFLNGKRFSAKRLKNMIRKAKSKKEISRRHEQSQPKSKLNSKSCDLVIMTALDEEMDAVLQHFPSESKAVNNRQVRFGERFGLRYAMMTMHGMGNVRAAAITMWAIMQFQPRYILMLGIAGGVKEKNERYLGDVLIPEFFVEYDHGKATTDGFKRRYQPFRSSRRLLELAKETRRASWSTQIRTKRPDGSNGRTNPLPHFGVMLSGQRVVTDRELMKELTEDWPKSIGVEMEAIGVATAAYERDNATCCLVIKGISDWADPEKSDGVWRDYAADASGAFAASLMEKIQNNS